MYNFKDYYLTERNTISSKLKNLFTTNKTYDINLKKMTDVREVDRSGYQEVISHLSRLVSRSRKKQFYGAEAENHINQIYKGILKSGSYKIGPYDKIEDASAYETNKNGIVALLITEKDSITNYFIAVDKKGLEFFKEIFGMLLSTFSSINKPDKKEIKKDLQNPLSFKLDYEFDKGTKEISNDNTKLIDNYQINYDKHTVRNIKTGYEDTFTVHEDSIQFEHPEKISIKVRNSIKDYFVKEHETVSDNSSSTPEIVKPSTSTYLEQLKFSKSSLIKDESKAETVFGFYKLDSKREYEDLTDRLMSYGKEKNNIEVDKKVIGPGKLTKYTINKNVVIYGLEVSEEYYLIFETRESLSFLQRETSVLEKMISDRDIYWIRGIAIEKLPRRM